MAASFVDLVGEDYIKANSAAARRATGSTYTPMWLVDEMVTYAAENIDPDVVVDCGCGSGRFAIACAERFSHARIIAVDISREACEMTRRNIEISGFSSRVTVVESDFLDFELGGNRGRILWIGNPPYVRHHDISVSTKSKFKNLANKLGINASLLSGLHVYFLARIAALWRQGDFGVLVTSAEWLDVNYGSFMRRLLLERLNLCSIEVFPKEEQVFEDAMTTAVVFGFGRERNEASFSSHGAARRSVPKAELRQSSKWSLLVDHLPGSSSDDLVPLGSLARVHRGVVTGNNGFWVRPLAAVRDIPSELWVPVVSHAKEIMGDCVAQNAPEKLDCLITLPKDFSGLSPDSRRAAEHIVEKAEERGVDKGYVASHRSPWWAVRPSRPPEIMMTYMARRAPVFVENRMGLSMLNVVHGVYLDAEVPREIVPALVAFLNENVSSNEGRTYCGGLTKFEPREAEAILVPRIEELMGWR